MSQDQLENWQQENQHKIKDAKTPHGTPYESLTSVLTVGHRGPPLLQDMTCIDLLQNFVRKNVPTRIVHGKGTSARGYFQLTNPEISNLSKAAMFQQVGKKIELIGRFGTPTEEGRADSERVFWAWSIKIYTEDGNQDILALNTPIFTIRDPKDFIGANISQFSNPQSGAAYRDPTAMWDYITKFPDPVHFLVYLHSDRGQPFGFRHLNAFPVNIFKLVNHNGDYVYARFQFKTNQGVRYLTNEEAARVRKSDPDFAARDFRDAIIRRDFPSFTWFVQIMGRDEPKKYFARTGCDPFDNTKVWPQGQYPLMEVGQIVFDRGMDNHFEDSVMSAFNPANLIPGIEAAVEDRIFHGRIFAYDDAQLYRLGANKSMIPVNRPKGLKEPLHTYFDRCPMNFPLGGMTKNYFPGGRVDHDGSKRSDDGVKKSETQVVEGVLGHYDHTKNDTFGQAKIFYENVIQQDERQRLAKNLAENVYGITPAMRKKVIELFAKVSEDLGRRLGDALERMRIDSIH